MSGYIEAQLGRDMSGTWHSHPIPPRSVSCLDMELVDICKSNTWDGKEVDTGVVIVDRHSGWIDAYPVKKKGCIAKQVAQLMHDRWLPTIGVPKRS